MKPPELVRLKRHNDHVARGEAGEAGVISTMAQRREKKSPAAEQLEVLGKLAEGPLDAGGVASLRQALRSSDNRVVARAAGIIKERRLDGFTQDLLGAFDCLRTAPTKSDAGCVAKLAVIEALDFTDCPDARPFLQAARMVQLEPSWGGAVDSAGPLRARAILALANLGHPDILLLSAELLSDAEAGVRQAAADAVAHCGARHGAALLLMASRRDAEDPMVVQAALSGLLSLAADWALPLLRELLDGPSQARELAAEVLGQSSREDAMDVLLEFIENCPLAAARAVVVNAIGLHRSDRALDALLKMIAEGRSVDAVASVRALSSRKFDPRLRQRVQDEVRQRKDVAVDQAFAEAFDVRKM